jgi:hypothetical protein
MLVGAALLCAAAAPSRAAPSQSLPQANGRPAIPFKQDTESTAALAGRGLAVLALAALAAYGGALALKRLGLTRPGLPGLARRVRRLETVRLSRRSVLHVVEYRGEELLLAEGEHGLRLLSSRPEGAADA